ncbi:GerMN domain-containing protein [Bacillus sp. 165]|uniref:GerMN domain-containing protein n=1 Tax=Bacillus sp. 165 TaxID=1529117 RepID=UPI001ADAD7DD|nr:GerMN domain-containing protein [Bacillus sp. 165]MBO9130536.1 GerMN domain-containing protein [Bacillus sp. 165]
MRKATGVKFITSVFAGAMMLSGCSLLGQDKEVKEVDPPQKVTYTDKETTPANTKEQQGANKTQEKQAKATVTRELYLVDKSGYVVPQSIPIPAAKDGAVVKQALQYLVKDGPVTELLPNGFQAVLPADTEVKQVNITKDGTAIADFSADFKNYKKEDERKIVEAVTWTLTQFENVRNVKFRINGKDLTAMPVDKTPIGKGLSRADGINFDDEEVVDIHNTKPVTLYFVAQNGKSHYYVPVTRRISNDSKDEVAVVIQELVKGPSYKSNLVSDFNADVKLLDAPEYQDGKVTLNFNENIYGNLGKNIISSYVLDSLVLSLTEQKGVESVAIEVDGKANVLNEKGKKLTKPVTRPQNVNTGSF